MSDNNIIIYQDDNDITHVSVRFANEDLCNSRGNNNFRHIITKLSKLSKIEIYEKIVIHFVADIYGCRC